MDRINYILSLACFAWGCSSSHSIQYEEADRKPISSIPNHIVAKVDSIIISKTGEQFFRSHFVLDSLQSRFISSDILEKEQARIVTTNPYKGGPFYSLKYDFRFPDKPWRKMTLWWYVDAKTEVAYNPRPDFVPDCASNPANCTFRIDSLDAIQIAKRAGLPEGITAPTAGFTTSKGRYAWGVGSTLTNLPSAKFVEYFVDMSSGEVIEKREGVIVP